MSKTSDRNNAIEIFDSTLRDGAQGEGISYSVQDKLNILRALDEFGVDLVEAGNPASNPKDAEFFRRAVALPRAAAEKRRTICRSMYCAAVPPQT